MIHILSKDEQMSKKSTYVNPDVLTPIEEELKERNVSVTVGDCVRNSDLLSSPHLLHWTHLRDVLDDANDLLASSRSDVSSDALPMRILSKKHASDNSGYTTVINMYSAKKTRTLYPFRPASSSFEMETTLGAFCFTCASVYDMWNWVKAIRRLNFSYRSTIDASTTNPCRYILERQHLIGASAPDDAPLEYTGVLDLQQKSYLCCLDSATMTMTCTCQDNAIAEGAMNNIIIKFDDLVEITVGNDCLQSENFDMDIFIECCSLSTGHQVAKSDSSNNGAEMRPSTTRRSSILQDAADGVIDMTAGAFGTIFSMTSSKC